MALNNTQLKRLRESLNKIKHEKLSTIKSDYTKEEKLQLIAQGKFTVYLSDYGSVCVELDGANEFKERYNKARREIEEQIDRAYDEAMFADNVEVIRILNHIKDIEV